MMVGDCLWLGCYCLFSGDGDLAMDREACPQSVQCIYLQPSEFSNLFEEALSAFACSPAARRRICSICSLRWTSLGRMEALASDSDSSDLAIGSLLRQEHFELWFLSTR